MTFEEYLQHLMGELEPGEDPDEEEGWMEPSPRRLLLQWGHDPQQRRVVCGHFVRLCNEFEQILGGVSERVAERVQRRVLWSPIGILMGWRRFEDQCKRDCIDAMWKPFANYYKGHPERATVDSYMWFDNMATFTESEWEQEQLLLTLDRILALGDEPCDFSALHGLGHLVEKGGRIAEAARSRVDAYIAAHKEQIESNPRVKRWILECREGTLM
ncbi:MAG: hypothetical protein AB7O52_19580 [Planctomycetota bacterium]